MTPRKTRRLKRLAERASDHNLAVLTATELYRVMGRTERLALAIGVYDTRRDLITGKTGQPGSYQDKGIALAAQLDAVLSNLFIHLNGSKPEQLRR